jgi:hypothetical protein
MFKDFKSGGYNMENCHVSDQRFIALVGLIAIAYTISTQRGEKIRAKKVQHYVARPTARNRRTQQHSQFWIGLYGSLWIESFNHWSDWAVQLIKLKPQKRSFYRRGLRAMKLIQSAL